MDAKTLVADALAEAKTVAQWLEAAATNPTVEKLATSTTALKALDAAIAADSTIALQAIPMVGALISLVEAAQALGARSATVDEMIAVTRDKNADFLE